MSDGLLDEREELTLPGVEQQGRVVDDQVLVEAEVPDGKRNGRIDAIDPVGDFLNIRAGL